MSSVKDIANQGNEIAMSSFIEGIVPKLLPYIEPMMAGIAEAFGNDEFIIVGRKNIKNNKVFIHIVKSKNVQKFEVAKISKIIELSEFFTKALSGEMKQYFDGIKNDLQED